MENLVDDQGSEGLVTFPDEGQDGDMQLDLVPNTTNGLNGINGLNQLNTSDTIKFEQKRMMNSSKTKVVANGFSSEQVH